jgi:hypothetical protein
MKNFINLADVKIYNDYTYIKTVVPTVAEKAPTYTTGETWLNTTTGYSYQLTDDVAGTWVQIETAQDALIMELAPKVFDTVIKYLNNLFLIERNIKYFDSDNDYETAWPSYWSRNDAYPIVSLESVYSKFVFSAGAKTITVYTDATVYGSITDSFQAGDTILISNSRRNDGYFTIVSVSDTVITVSEDLTDSTSFASVFLADVPAALISVIAHMVQYDIFTRPDKSGIETEKVGTFSVTYRELAPGLQYPGDIVSGLNVYEGTTIGGISYFVN